MYWSDLAHCASPDGTVGAWRFVDRARVSKRREEAGGLARALTPMRAQIRDLDKGTFGFVQQAVDLTTGEQVAIKFIERSQEVQSLGCPTCLC